MVKSERYLLFSLLIYVYSAMLVGNLIFKKLIGGINVFYIINYFFSRWHKTKYYVSIFGLIGFNKFFSFAEISPRWTKRTFMVITS